MMIRLTVSLVAAAIAAALTVFVLSYTGNDTHGVMATMAVIAAAVVWGVFAFTHS